jgi:3-oxoadipate enol-lactonase
VVDGHLQRDKAAIAVAEHDGLFAAGLPNARLTVLPGCAHVPQLQSPELFLGAIETFLREAIS